MTSMESRVIGPLALAVIAAAAAVPARGAETVLEEVIVTAQRREAVLEEVPVAITALTGQEIAARGIVDYASYLTGIPGAGMQDTSAVGGEIKFRGVGTGQNGQMSPTTAVYFGDVPVIHTGRNVNSSYNFRLVDMDRVEVLRGPQGQLYGANSLGGAIKNIPNHPVMNEFHAMVALTGSDTEDGSTGYDVEAVLNLPLAQDSLALRLVGYAARDSGWYDNAFRGGPVLGTLPVPPPGAPGSLLPLIFQLQPAAAGYAAPPLDLTDDTNETDTYGARALLAWQISDRFDLTLTYAHEERDTDGAAFASYANPFTLPPFVQPPPMDYRDYEHYEASTAGMADEIDLASLELNYDFGGATLTSVTSWWERTEQLDISLSLISFPVVGQPHAFPQISTRNDNPQVFTQELRLTSNTDGRLDWLLGLFYQNIDQDHRVFAYEPTGLDLRYYQTVALSIVTGGLVPMPNTTVLADNRANYEDEQVALFGELGFDFTDTLHGSASFRWFDVDQSFESESSGFQFGLAQGRQSGDNSESVFTPRFALDWSPTDNQMYYVSASEGFRTGIINRDLPQLDCGAELAGLGYPDGLPPTDADTLWNYEIGAKFSSPEGRFRLAAAAYHGDWKDMQLNVPLSAFSPDPAFSLCSYDGVVNAGDATTEGLEIEASAVLMDNVRLDVALGWTDAEFDTTIPQLNIHEGDAIPFTPDVTASVGLTFGFTLGSLPGFVRANWLYVGDKDPLTLDFPVFQYPNGVPFDIGHYYQTDLRAALDLTGQLRIEAFVTNLFDEYGITSASTTGGLGYPLITTIRPRTIGATLRWQY